MKNTIMVRDSLNKISKMERFNQWFYASIKPFLGNRILDAGCGNGNIAGYLQGKELLVAVDIDSHVVEDIRVRLSEFNNLKLIKSDITNGQFPGLIKENNIDTVLCVNTLEHIENDAGAIRNFYEILEPKGRLIVLVPALKFLFSSLDKAAGHYRRYSKREIIQRIEDRGFSIEHSAYFNLFGVIGWFLFSRILKRKEFSAGSLCLFESLVGFFIFMEKICCAPFGLSILIVARKNL